MPIWRLEAGSGSFCKKNQKLSFLKKFGNFLLLFFKKEALSPLDIGLGLCYLFSHRLNSEQGGA
jgi:hypothetical protein